ncbi:DUF2530 domain-containing protein [Streptomyces zingiberis]|uniref:DUF2530 domain-containing protein n=1 Tax=Streptomyces zingiberis TaxID=2053010 RepID=A0ABX1BQG3_9ACTN|nr:DUF2530 domain-containing protein [Streptomyces zingiberis]NJP99960.1 DUF2530 domain-containing protein [Streptomyces zingiberis]
MGRWTPTHEAPEPLEGNVVAVVTGGTLLWFALFLVQLPFYGVLRDHGLLWWLWTCLAGGLLGCYGVWYVRRRDAAIKRAAGERETPGGESAPAPGAAPGDTPAPGDGGPGPRGDAP